MSGENFLAMALDEAEQALQDDRTPVGAILVDRDNNVVARSSSVARSDEKNRSGSILHAELRLILDNQHLFGNNLPFTIYTSLEPCHMCMGAIIVSRITTVVWATDDFWGGATKLYDSGREYLKDRMPVLARTPYPELQRRGADLWVTHLEKTGHPEYIERILKWQTRIVA